MKLLNLTWVLALIYVLLPITSFAVKPVEYKSKQKIEQNAENVNNASAFKDLTKRQKRKKIKRLLKAKKKGLYRCFFSNKLTWIGYGLLGVYLLIWALNISFLFLPGGLCFAAGLILICYTWFKCLGIFK